MAHESQDVDDIIWPPHIEHIFIEIMVEEQIKGNMENGVFKGPMWEIMTQELNKRTVNTIPLRNSSKSTIGFGVTQVESIAESYEVGVG